jgi:hypothetical protein
MRGRGGAVLARDFRGAVHEADGGGGRATAPLAETVLVVPDGGTGGTFHDLLERCQGQRILRVATSAERYAAITRTRLVYGELAAAPDLPRGE